MNQFHYHNKAFYGSYRFCTIRFHYNEGNFADLSGDASDSDSGSDDHSLDQPATALLAEMATKLTTVLDRLDKTEDKLNSMERKLEKSVSASPRKKRTIPKVVRVSIPRP